MYYRFLLRCDYISPQSPKCSNDRTAASRRDWRRYWLGSERTRACIAAEREKWANARAGGGIPQSVQAPQPTALALAPDEQQPALLRARLLLEPAEGPQRPWVGPEGPLWPGWGGDARHGWGWGCARQAWRGAGDLFSVDCG